MSYLIGPTLLVLVILIIKSSAGLRSGSRGNNIGLRKPTLRVKSDELEADLVSADQIKYPSMAGEIESNQYTDGGNKFEVKITGEDVPQGETLEVLCDGQFLSNIELKGSYTKIKIRNQESAIFAQIKSGDLVEVSWKSTVVLKGTLCID